MFDLESVYFGNSLYAYLKAIAVFTVAFTICYVLAKLFHAIGVNMSKKAKNSFMALLLRADKRLVPIFLYIPFYAITNYFLVLPPTIVLWVNRIGVFIVVYSVVRFMLEVIYTLLRRHQQRSQIDPMIASSVEKIITAAVWVFALIFMLNNMGFNTTSLIAGLGIGGMAIALASQTLVSDWFNYFTILIDKPFKIGDTVRVGGITGSVTSIGLKATRILGPDGEEISVSNTDMTKSVLQNLHTVRNRRAIATLALRYDTPVEKLRAVPDLLKSIVESVSDTTFSRAYFKEFGESAFNFELSYLVNSTDLAMFMDRTQTINFKILDEFKKRGIGFALPGRSVYMESEKS